jgi:hypothetical protein
MGGQRLWTVEELSVYNGTDEGLPILLGILGYSCFSLICQHFCFVIVQSFLLCCLCMIVTNGQTKDA